MLYKVGRNKLLAFFGLFSLAVVGDWLKFEILGGPNIINWHSLVHPAWVFSALFFLAVGIAAEKRIIWQSLFGLYLAIFLAALLNQYYFFTALLTYNCMLFNLVFVAIYFFLNSPQSSDQP